MALAVAAWNTGLTGSLGPSPRAGDLPISTAATHYLVEVERSAVSRRAKPLDPGASVRRAELLGRLAASAPVAELLARRIGIAPEQVGSLARVTASVPSSMLEPDSERRSTELERSQRPYRVEIQARQTAPVLDVYSQAPTTAAAVRLAETVGPALDEYLDRVARERGAARAQPAALRQLGPARAGVANSNAVPGVFAVTFVVAFALTLLALLGAAELARRTRRGPLAERSDAPADDDWPHTARLLPWAFAGFVALIWLVPFTDVQLDVPAPIDITLDRILLPVVILAWLVALLTGGRSAPRLRVTPTHVALAGFVVCAFLGVALSAGHLNQAGELDLALKKLPLLISYVLLFAIAASGVRPSEVPAFLSYTLGLAVVCAVGLIWEYRYRTNLFHDLVGLLPGRFEVEPYNDALDHLGRRVVRGPAEVGLEAVTMLALALPIALTRFVDTRGWRRRLLYGLAAGLLLAAMLATYRKSALLAPLAVFVTLIALRPREVLRLAPLGIGLFALARILSPGAIGSTLSQFLRPDRADVPTVSDRVADYDAVRPDLWTHFAFGRGFGSYDHETYRILDSEILHRLVEMGVLGLVAFLAIPVTVIWAARRALADGDPARASIALVGACAGACFLVVATLYDVLSFAHGVYAFLYIAGLVAVAQTAAPAPKAPTPATPPPRPAPEPFDHALPSGLWAFGEAPTPTPGHERSPVAS